MNVDFNKSPHTYMEGKGLNELIRASPNFVSGRLRISLMNRPIWQQGNKLFCYKFLVGNIF